MPGNDLIFFGSTGPGGTTGDNVPDPADWLGRFRASNPLHQIQSTLTANQATGARYAITDSARIGDGADAHALKWIAIQTGPAAMAAARVERFDDSTGTFKLDRELGPGLAVLGNAYALFARGNVFPTVTAAQAAAGDVRFRSIAFLNSHGAPLADVKVYIRALNFPVQGMDRFHQPAHGGWIERDDDETALFDSIGQRVVGSGLDGMVGSGPWLHPHSYDSSDTIDPSLPDTQALGIWLRRTIDAGSQFRNSLAVQIIAESTTAGSDPDPLKGTALIVFDIAGASPTAAAEHDRHVYVGGGARHRFTVTAEGAPVVNRAVQIAIQSGDPGTLDSDENPLPGFTTTDSAGDAFATYHAPTSPAFDGTQASVEVTIGAGDEVGDPQP